MIHLLWIVYAFYLYVIIEKWENYGEWDYFWITNSSGIIVSKYGIRYFS